MDYNKVIMALIVVIVALIVAGIVLFNPFIFKTDTALSVTSSNELNEGDELSILLTDADSKPIANQVVQVNITDSSNHVEQKTITTNGEGVGVLSLSGLSAGQYNVNVTYGGNDTFNPSQSFQNLNIKQVVTQPVGSANYLPSDTSIHPGFTPSYRDGNLVYGYKGNRYGFVTPTGNFHEM